MDGIILRRDGVDAFERWQNTTKWVAKAAEDLKRHQEQNEIAIRQFGNYLMPHDAPIGTVVLVPLLNSFIRIEKTHEDRVEPKCFYKIGWWNDVEGYSK